MKRIKSKKALGLAALLLLASATASAQVFGLEDESDNRKEGTENVDGGVVLGHSSTQDQSNYTSLGSGTLLLLAFGGAYALKKRK